MGITVFSGFDGMSCGQLALKKAGIEVDKYYASEVDKHAIKVTQQNFPNTIQLGDISQIKGSDLPPIDLFIGGSPCQGFSFAGKQLNFNDPRSKLFFEFYRLYLECNAKNFLLENVRMKKEYELTISRLLDVQPLKINSALISAQNRIRLYWTSIGQVKSGLFDRYSIIKQPRDHKIFLADVLQDAADVDDKYYLTGKKLAWWENKKEVRIKKRLAQVNGGGG